MMIEKLEDLSRDLEDHFQIMFVLESLKAAEKEYERLRYQVLANLHSLVFDRREKNLWPWSLNPDMKIDALVLELKNMYAITAYSKRIRAGFSLTQEIAELEKLIISKGCPVCKKQSLAIKQKVVSCIVCGFGNENGH